MPEVTIAIGGREFEVACQEGEEHFLLSAAKMLDAEAQTLLNQIGRMPEARMLLMAGLLLADKAAGAEDRVRAMETQVGQMQAQLEAAQEAARTPQTVEVARIPDEVTDTLAELAARAEALAERSRSRAGSWRRNRAQTRAQARQRWRSGPWSGRAPAATGGPRFCAMMARFSAGSAYGVLARHFSRGRNDRAKSVPGQS